MAPEKYLAMNWVELIAHCERLEAALREARPWIHQDTDALACHKPYDPDNPVDQDVRREVEARRAWLIGTSENEPKP